MLYRSHKICVTHWQIDKLTDKPTDRQTFFLWVLYTSWNFVKNIFVKLKKKKIQTIITWFFNYISLNIYAIFKYINIMNNTIFNMSNIHSSFRPFWYKRKMHKTMFLFWICGLSLISFWVIFLWKMWIKLRFKSSNKINWMVKFPYFYLPFH